jgi:hypothetical protein
VVAAGSAAVDVDNADIPGGLVLGAGFSDPRTVNVPSGGVASKNTAYVPDGILPDLTIAKSHTGDFTQGQSGAVYTLIVTNAGPGDADLHARRRAGGRPQLSEHHGHRVRYTCHRTDRHGDGRNGLAL